MYEDLVRQLRACANNVLCETADCGYKPFGNQDCIEQLELRAADTIEELSREYESVAASLTESVELVRKLQSPRWVSVTEQLPKNEKDVLAYYGFKHDGVLSDQRFIGTLCYFRFDPNPHWQHEGQGKLTVTHWMPLPEPPKEKGGQEDT